MGGYDTDDDDDLAQGGRGFGPLGENAARALRRCLAPSLPREVHALLFGAADAATVRGMRAAVEQTRCVAPFTGGWNPYACDVLQPGHTLYSVLVMRIAVLRRLCGGAAAAPATHYAHALLDAHLLAACAVEDLGYAPADGSAAEAALRAHYEWCWRRGACFGVHSLPRAARDALERCNLLGSAPRRRAAASQQQQQPQPPVDALQLMLTRALPLRCQARQLCASMVVEQQDDAGITDCAHAMLLASLLGVYRHARARAPFARRLALYRAFFHCEPAGACGALLRHAAAARGGSALRFATRASRVAAFNAFLGARRAGARAGHTLLHQPFALNAVREFICALLPSLPHLQQALELCVPRWFSHWQPRGVFRYADAVRARSLDATPVPLHVVLPPHSAAPSNALYEAPSLSAAAAAAAAGFDTLLAAECATQLDARGAADTPCEQHFTPEHQHLMRALVQAAHRACGDASLLRPCVGTPQNAAQLEEFARAGRVPVRWLGAEASVVRVYNAAQRAYAERRAACDVTAFAGWLAARRTVFQLHWVRHFAAAAHDARRVHVERLPPVVVAAQRAALCRTRLPLLAAELAAGRVTRDAALERALCNFVCLCCRRFCGTLAPAADEPLRGGAAGADVTRGACDASLAHETLTTRIARNYARTGSCMPPVLFAAISSVEYFTRVARLDVTTHFYPPDPSAFNAPADALQAARQFAAAHPTPAFVPPSAQDVLDVGTAAAAAATIDEVSWPESTWVCASKRYKVQGRKTKQTHATRQRVADSIVDPEAANALRNGDRRRRRDARLFYAYAQCALTPLLAVPMLGHALYLDERVYAACCNCTGYLDLAAAAPQQYRGALFYCARCALPGGTLPQHRCHVCHKPAHHTVYGISDEDNCHHSEFHLCHTHAPASLLRTPVYAATSALQLQLRPRAVARRGRHRQQQEHPGNAGDEGTPAWMARMLRQFEQAQQRDDTDDAAAADSEEEEEEEQQ